MAEVDLKRPLVYAGKRQPVPGEKDAQGRVLYPYFPSKGLVEAVNLSIYLKRPLLLKGEPGCGKTRLARAVAYELGLPFESWYIKSTSRARDGLYVYDAVRRLRDAQFAALDHRKESRSNNIDDPMAYIQMGPLGRAFQNEQRTVVLIDEIDKADIDFPNDLLYELEELAFEVEEAAKHFHAKQPPIVFITSNDEKDLPDAFLRRCLFYYVEFPDREQLLSIVKARFHTHKLDERVLQAGINRFLELREEMRRQKGEMSKRVSTSELIDWFDMLSRIPPDTALAQFQGRLPFPSVLLKSWDDHRRFIARAELGNEAVP